MPSLQWHCLGYVQCVQRDNTGTYLLQLAVLLLQLRHQLLVETSQVIAAQAELSNLQYRTHGNQSKSDNGRS